MRLVKNEFDTLQRLIRNKNVVVHINAWDGTQFVNVVVAPYGVAAYYINEHGQQEHVSTDYLDVEAGFKIRTLDKARGVDHGVWPAIATWMQVYQTRKPIPGAHHHPRSHYATPLTDC